MTAPKEILGDFQRMTKPKAANCIFRTEAKNKGWSTEDRDTALPPEMKEEGGYRGSMGGGHPPMPPMPHMGRAAMDVVSMVSRWEGTPPHAPPPGPPGPPRESLSAVAMEVKTGLPRQFGWVQEHGDRNNGAFNKQRPMRRMTVGLLGPPPCPAVGAPAAAGVRGPANLMDIPINKEEVIGFLNKQRQESTKCQKSEAGAWTPVGGEETQICHRTSCVTPDIDDGSLVSNKGVHPRKMSIDQEAEEREKDRRLMELDLDSIFGDLELPPLVPWKLIPIEIEKSDLSDLKHHFSSAQLEDDPRLRKFVNSGMTELKELPKPSFRVSKRDPRMRKTKPDLLLVPGGK